MSQVATYLNFARETEEAFNYYKQVFGTDFDGPIMRFSDIPPQEGQPPIADADKNLVMHVSLPTIGGHHLMGTDAPESMGFTVTKGNSVYIMLQPDTRAETERLFKALTDGGNVEMDLQDMFWGDYFGSGQDKFGINWMFNCSQKA